MGVTRKEALQILKLQEGASELEIKTRFRSFTRDCHPDKYPGNETIAEMFKQASTAYSILLGEFEPDPEPETQDTPKQKKEPPRWLMRAAQVAADRKNKDLLKDLCEDEDAADAIGIFARSFLSQMMKGK